MCILDSEVRMFQMASCGQNSADHWYLAHFRYRGKYHFRFKCYLYTHSMHFEELTPKDEPLITCRTGPKFCGNNRAVLMHFS